VVTAVATGASITATRGGVWFNGAQFGLSREGNPGVQADNHLALAGATGLFVTALTGPADLTAANGTASLKATGGKVVLEATDLLVVEAGATGVT
jgi:hypothetical protein